MKEDWNSVLKNGTKSTSRSNRGLGKKKKNAVARSFCFCDEDISCRFLETSWRFCYCWDSVIVVVDVGLKRI